MADVAPRRYPAPWRGWQGRAGAPDLGCEQRSDMVRLEDSTCNSVGWGPRSHGFRNGEAALVADFPTH